MDYEMKKAGSGKELAVLYLKRYEKAKSHLEDYGKR